MFGFLIGSAFWGRCSDRFGRKPVKLLCLFFAGIFGIASALSNHIVPFTILRTLVSFFVIGAGIVSNAFFGELFPPRHRLCLAFVLNWAPNLLVVTCIAFLCQTWRIFAIVLGVISIPAIALMWFLDETPHFLLRSGKAEKSMEVIKRIHQINGQEIDLKELRAAFREERLHEEETKIESYSFLHLFCTPQLIAYTLAICFSNFEAGFISYSLLFNLEKISGSLYENLIFVGLIRYVFNLLSATAEYKWEWLGRKLTHRFFCSITIVALLISIIGELFDAPELVGRIFLLTTAAIIGQLFSLLGIVCNEIFPTALRNTSYAFTLVVESLGTILAPHLYSISEKLWPPLIIMICCVSVDLVVFSLVVPESRGKPLPDKMPENEKRFTIFRDKKRTIAHEMN